MSNSYGVVPGFFTYCSLKYNKSGKIKIPKIKFPIFFRPKSIDEYTIIEIFGLKCYDLDLPFDPKFIIDGGANIGLSSVYFANKYPESQIVAVEPETSNFDLLLKNIKNYNNIKANKCAIWDKNILLEIKDNGFGLRGFMVEETPIESNTSINGVTIDDVNSKGQIIDILKLDIEGSEKFVFEKNYKKWLPNTRCIIIELHDDMVEGSSESVYQTIAKYNFRKYQKGENKIFINKELI